MSIHVRLSTTLRECVPGYVPEEGLNIDLAPEETSITAGELASRLGIPAAEIKIVMINGRQGGLRNTVADGDRIAYFPAVGGG